MKLLDNYTKALHAYEHALETGEPWEQEQAHYELELAERQLNEECENSHQEVLH